MTIRTRLIQDDTCVRTDAVSPEPTSLPSAASALARIRALNTIPLENIYYESAKNYSFLT